jgi:hypothetical protein
MTWPFYSSSFSHFGTVWFCDPIMNRRTAHLVTGPSDGCRCNLNQLEVWVLVKLEVNSRTNGESRE